MTSWLSAVEWAPPFPSLPTVHLHPREYLTEEHVSGGKCSLFMTFLHPCSQYRRHGFSLQGPVRWGQVQGACGPLENRDPGTAA